MPDVKCKALQSDVVVLMDGMLLVDKVELNDTVSISYKYNQFTIVVEYKQRNVGFTCCLPHKQWMKRERNRSDTSTGYRK